MRQRFLLQERNDGTYSIWREISWVNSTACSSVQRCETATYSESGSDYWNLQKQQFPEAWTSAIKGKRSLTASWDSSRRRKKNHPLTLEFLKVPLFVFLAGERSIWHPSLEGGPAVKMLGLALSMLLLSRWPNSRLGPSKPHPALRPDPGCIKSLSSPTC